jgi:AcrR family transcriptional regulator
MATRAERRRERIFEDALAAARNIAAADGLTGLTARRIAGRVGCSVGTLYNVFDSLDGLILYLNGRTLDALFEALSPVPEGADPKAAVNTLVGRYLAFTRANGRLWGVIFEHNWPQDFPRPDWYPAKVQRLLRLLEAAMAPLFPDGAAEESHQAARVLWCGLHGIGSLAEAGKLAIIDADDVTRMCETLVETYLAGLALRAPG